MNKVLVILLLMATPLSYSKEYNTDNVVFCNHYQWNSKTCIVKDLPTSLKSKYENNFSHGYFRIDIVTLGCELFGDDQVESVTLAQYEGDDTAFLVKMRKSSTDGERCYTSKTK